MEVVKVKVAPVASLGGQLNTLEALRDRLAGAIDATTSARDVAMLSSRLMDVMKLIGEQDAVPKSRTPLDELHERRETKLRGRLVDG
ncbi:hypothetical protein [Rhodococcus erythropolis]|uniref:Uncharacterized protein n=1 Tax=Rhodococcus erythropolis (strain PR4 / NBRC 100887) TaxID=234621 RepID=C0ZWN0_RHOE4|nr:hypothetical protein [Rhodococcus erythropolis]BAH32765.1 hypothetical protein RER_20570 [Rhodococcus erythropolis PR4]